MGLEWVESGAFHIPVLPTDLGVDPILAALLHMACFMEFSDEKAVNFDESITAMETMGYYFQFLTPDRRSDVGAQLKLVAEYAENQKWKGETIEFISDLLKNSGIED
jgi:hypothetical protein